MVQHRQISNETPKERALTSQTAERLPKLRFAIVALFFSFGLVVSTWAVYLPAVKRATDVTNSQLGIILLAVGAGAIAGMQTCGRLIDRHGSVPVALIGSAVMTAALFLPLTAHTFHGAAAGALCFGAAAGATDVGMNAAAVVVERDYGRPIMASFHAFFSVGTVTGALAGVAFISRTALLTTAFVSGAAAIALTTAAAAAFRGVRLRHQRGEATALEHTDGHALKVVILGLLAFLLMLAEGSAMDWSSLHAQTHLGGSPTWGAIAVGSFVSAMTVGRFTADRIAAQIGPVAMLRLGSLLAAVGFLIVVVSTSLPLTMIGWAAAGFGLAGGVPQVFTAAGNLGTATAMSRVIGVGYVAILAGPSSIGWLADRFSLNTAFLMPLSVALLCAAIAAAVRPSQ